MKTIAIAIGDDLLNRIDRLVQEFPGKRGNRSSLIRQAVREHLSRLDRITEEEREKVIFRSNRRTLERQAKALVKEQAKP